MFYDGEFGRSKTSFKYLHVFGDFFETFGLEFIAGAPFKEDHAENQGFIINETGLKALNLQGDPTGQTIEFWGEQGPVIGVVKDFHNGPLSQEIVPLIIVSNKKYKNRAQHVYVRLNEQALANTVAFVENKFAELLPGYPVDDVLLNDDYDKRYGSLELFNKIVLFSSMIALFTSGIGLLGMILFRVDRKTKEIAIRKVNGAKAHHIALTLLGSFTRAVLYSFPFVCLLAWYVMHTWLQYFAYRTTIDWWVFALAGLITLAIAILTVGYHTIRASLASPIHALRNE